jgi:outer membrane biogenesis lipoprotein LolB
MKILCVIAVLILAACATPGKDLPMVKDSDPIWPLAPDHITPSDIPR